MNEHELAAAFEAGALEPEAFHHREHLRLTWTYLARYGRPETERRLVDGLRAFAARAGKPDKFNEPLTLAWIAAVDRVRRAEPVTASFDEAVARHPELLDRRRPPLVVAGTAPLSVT